MSKFKVCPFCLGDEIYTAKDYWHYGSCHSEYWFAHCSDCGADGPMAKTEDEAIRFWNDRPEEEE